MLFQKLALVAALSDPVFGEELLGSFIFCRHGDRLKKPTTYLSPIGAQEVDEVGRFYRDRYNSTLQGLSGVYNSSEISALVPGASNVLFSSALAFMQGFFPPTQEYAGSTIDAQSEHVPGSEFNNDTTIVSPLGGYQYVNLASYDPESELYWRVEGKTECPACDDAGNAYLTSAEFKQLNSSTLEFYSRMHKYVPELKKSKMNYGNAYTVYDHMEYAYWHNETFKQNLDMDDFFQVKTLQDQYSTGINVFQPADLMLGGSSLLGLARDYISQVQNKTAPAFSLVMGSYDQFYQAFALLGLFDQDKVTFTGIAEYATSLVFEVYQDGNNQMVRVGVRNGTTITQPTTELKFWPTFNGSANATDISSFLTQISKVGVNNADDWCSLSKSSTAAACEIKNLRHKGIPSHMYWWGGVEAVLLGVAVIALAGLVFFYQRKVRKLSRPTEKEMELNSLKSGDVSTATMV